MVVVELAVSTAAVAVEVVVVVAIGAGVGGTGLGGDLKMAHITIPPTTVAITPATASTSSKSGLQSQNRAPSSSVETAQSTNSARQSTGWPVNKGMPVRVSKLSKYR